jgi:hypothetical protein
MGGGHRYAQHTQQGERQPRRSAGRAGSFFRLIIKRPTASATAASAMPLVRRPTAAINQPYDTVEQAFSGASEPRCHQPNHGEQQRRERREYRTEATAVRDARTRGSSFSTKSTAVGAALRSRANANNTNRRRRSHLRDDSVFASRSSSEPARHLRHRPYEAQARRTRRYTITTRRVCANVALSALVEGSTGGGATFNPVGAYSYANATGSKERYLFA